MPGQRVRGFSTIRAFAVEERHGFIWIWPGEAEKADRSLIPDLPLANHPEWAYGGGLFHINCDCRLMIDNLMDLTHETYGHASNIGQPEIDEIPCVTRTGGNEVITSRFMNGIEAPPFWKMALRGNKLPDGGLVDRWQVCHFTPPSHVMIEVGVALQGNGGYEAPADKKASSIVVDFITPESDTSIWYSWGMARHFQPQDEALTASIHEGQNKIFRKIWRCWSASKRTCWPGLARPQAARVEHRRGRRAIAARDRAAACRRVGGPRRGGERMSTVAALSVRVARKALEALDIQSFELVAADGAALPAFTAGSHIDVFLPGGLIRTVLAVQPAWRDTPSCDRRLA